jgi:membrane protein YqaA with SNARE-associated domain
MHRFVLWIQGVLVPVLGPFGFFLAALLDSSVLTLPEINDFLVVTSSSARPEMAWLYVSATTFGSLAGCLALREIGRRGGESRLEKQFGKERVAAARSRFERFGVLTLAVPALLPPPMPFKMFVLAAGAFGFPLRRFIVTLLLARGLRYSVWSALAIAYGEKALQALKSIDGWFGQRVGLLSAILCCALLLTFVALGARQRRSSRRSLEGE